ncbi:hypothetical protein [Celerinatantimonas sp. YJH-8]
MNGTIGFDPDKPFKLIIDVGQRLIILAVIGAIAVLLLTKVIKG